MPVSKEELFARYKQLKAEGQTVSLMELKKQMEAESEQNSFNENSQNENYSAQSVEQNNYTQPQMQSWTNDYSNHSSQSVEQNTYTQPQTQSWTNDYSNQESQSEEQNTYTQPQTQSWTNNYSNQLSQTVEQNTYSQQVVQPQHVFNNNVGLQSQSMEQYSTSQTNLSYQPTENNSSTQNISPTVQNTQIEQPKYTGNINQESFSINQNQTDVKKFCLIGYPLGHSLSKPMHNAGFSSLGIDATYDIIETPPEELVDRIKFLKSNGYSGFNVTIPLKLPVTLFLDEVDMSADVVGAVNTVVINPDKTLKGYNTDVIGFRNAIPNDFVLAGKVAAVLGTGGAARAALTALAQSQVKKIKIYTRNIPNSLDLLTFLRNKFPNVEFEALQIEYIRDLSDVEILVNTTPIGMLGRSADMTPVEEKEICTLPAGALVYDVIYNPKKTILLKLAEKHGYKIINGVDMFVKQAVAAEQIWTNGLTPDFKDMKIAVLENLDV